jgi:hypothetical protein
VLLKSMVNKKRNCEALWENEYLKLAGTYLACRWKAMGHTIEGDLYPGPLQWSLLGMHDYALEMELILQEADLTSPSTHVSVSQSIQKGSSC